MPPAESYVVSSTPPESIDFTHRFPRRSIIFASTYLLGFESAPRIKGVGRQQIYALKKRKHYEELGYTLLPDRCIPTDC